MSSEIEQRLRAEMGTASDSRPDWIAVELRAARQRRRRVRSLQVAIATFAVALGAIAVSPSVTRGANFEPAFGGGPTVEDDYRLPAFLALTLTAGISIALLGAARRNRPSQGSTGWRRMWPVLTFIPVAYPAAQLIELGSQWAMVAQTAAIPCYPLLFWLLAERVGEQPNRFVIAAAFWSSIGVTTVLGTVALIDEVLVRSNNQHLWRLWPNRGQEMPGLDIPLGPEWTVNAIAGRELVAVVLIAIITALSLRIIGPDRPGVAALWVPVIVYLAIATYELLTPWGFHIDFDFFISDAVLGSVIGELTFPVGPVDLVSSIALGIASLSMGLLLWSWGGPAPGRKREAGSTDPKREEPPQR